MLCYNIYYHDYMPKFSIIFKKAAEKLFYIFMLFIIY